MTLPNTSYLTDKNASRSQSIVKRGAHSVSSRGKDANETAVVPASTLRAVQLRNGKGGSFGTGEVMKIPGREKLELLAEDEMKKADRERRNLYEANMNSAVKAPFQLETVLKIAQSQMDAYIDLLNALHNPDLCYDIILREVEAHYPPANGREDQAYLRVPSFVAEQFGACVHNAHMLASGWVILYETFRKLQEMGLRDRDLYAQLKTDETLHDVYLSAYNLLQKIVTALQQRLRSIVQNTPHYAPYFRDSNDMQDRQEIEKSEIKRMYKSFLDSTIIELCVPGSKFSTQALYFCLHATQEETPKLLKRCPQLMWDAVGDLSEAVKLLDIMETALINKDQDFKNDEDRIVFNEFALWNEAQPKSVKAAMDYSSFVNLVHPLTNLQNKTALNKLWNRLNANYVRESGQNIDALWQLVDARYRVPHFSTLAVPSEILHGVSKDKGKELVPARQNTVKKSGRVVDDGDSDDSMPSLRAVSDSEDEYEEWDSDDDGEDERDVYDSDEEADLKRKQREAIDRSLEDPDVLDLNNDLYAEERKKNPFLALLGNLRGRLFSSSTILRTDGETTVTSRPTKAPSSKKTSAKPTGLPKTDDETGEDVQRKAAVEDAEDESGEPKDTSENKKKHKKKKKKKKSADANAKASPAETPSSPVPEPPRSPSLPPDLPEPAASTFSTSPTPKSEKKTTPKSPSAKSQSIKTDLSGTTATAFGSTTTLSLPQPQEQKAPSAHSYLKEIGAETKTKIKTRREPTVEVIPEKKERRNLFDRLRGKDRDLPEGDEKQKDTADIFSRLRRKTVSYARKLIGVSAQDKKGSLKWEQFLQVMRELGFEYDPSTAGSSVRFDPPNPNDRSITFHKPHPDPTLYPYLLREYRFKLEAYYGWSPEKFEKAVQDLGRSVGNDDD